MNLINMFKPGALLLALALSTGAIAADYRIDDKGAHASINFKVKHLGYSWLTGRFNTFSGTFSYDDNKVEATKISVDIDTTSIDSNHAERDKHLKGKDFLDVAKFPAAKFVSTGVKQAGAGKYTVTGDFTFHGVTKSVVIDAEKVGEGEDPWGGYRAGFAGTTVIALEDYGIKNILGPASADVMLELHIEGIRQ